MIQPLRCDSMLRLKFYISHGKRSIRHTKMDRSRKRTTIHIGRAQKPIISKKLLSMLEAMIQKIFEDGFELGVTKEEDGTFVMVLRSGVEAKTKLKIPSMSSSSSSRSD